MHFTLPDCYVSSSSILSAWKKQIHVRPLYENVGFTKLNIIMQSPGSVLWTGGNTDENTRCHGINDHAVKQRADPRHPVRRLFSHNASSHESSIPPHFNNMAHCLYVFKLLRRGKKSNTPFQREVTLLRYVEYLPFQHFCKPPHFLHTLSATINKCITWGFTDTRRATLAASLCNHDRP